MSHNRAQEVLEARPLHYKNQDTRHNNPIPYIVTTYNTTPEARTTENGRAEPRGIPLIKKPVCRTGGQ
jgi:hypothetical protein